jgi:hypothetical protein
VKATLNEISPCAFEICGKHSPSALGSHDGNRWMHESGATIIAHRNTLKHLSQTTHVDDWNWTFSPAPVGARPTVLVDEIKRFLLQERISKYSIMALAIPMGICQCTLNKPMC